MSDRGLFTAKSNRSIKEFIERLNANAPEFNFQVRHILKMHEEYRESGQEIEDDFELYQIIICNFARSYNAIKKNPDRAAVLLQPKMIIAYPKKDGDGCVINYAPYSGSMVAEILPGDAAFQESLPESCGKIKKLIEASV